MIMKKSIGFWKRWWVNLALLQIIGMTWIPIPFIFTTCFKTHFVYQFDSGEMAPLCRFEPVGSEILEIEPEASQLLKNIGWKLLFRNFNGHHT